jgi:hypothetical protein
MVDILGVGSLDIVQDAGLDDDDLSRLPSQNKYKYVQKTIKSVERSFVLFDNIYLNYCLENIRPKGFKERPFKDKSVALCTVNLTYIDSKPDIKRRFAWGWFIAAIVILVLAFAISEHNTFSHKAIFVLRDALSGFKLTHIEIQQVTIGLAAFGVVALIVSYFRTCQAVIYKSGVGQVPVFQLRCYPRDNAYKKFIKVLGQCIYKAHNRRGITMNYRLVGELKYLKNMNEAGIVTSSDYEKARKAIFSHEEYS